MHRSLFALNALNFFMADVQGGLGPFLATRSIMTSACASDPLDADAATKAIA